ncbi:methyltransferase [Actinomadura roseirufa]|uniref:methyltransferase n=1 Tax=Actinomadura roseirufa TaxID=2094049 RepID=UPI001F5F18E9|nr:methyltransferase [Actinomadura roseirufa]
MDVTAGAAPDAGAVPAQSGRTMADPVVSGPGPAGGARGDDWLRRRANLATPMAVRVAATLRLADQIAEDGSTAADVAERVRVDPGALERLMDYLVTVGVLAGGADGRYRLTPEGEPLREGHPRSMRALLDTRGALGRAELSFVELLHSVRTGEAAYPHRYGRTLWEDMQDDPGLAADFDAFMASWLAASLPALMLAYDWASLRHVVDVGGGNGRFLAALLTACPALRGTLVEQPGPAADARAALAEAGVAGRAEVVVGSFFDALPAEGGGYVLANVLHDWGDEDCARILRRCAQAAGRAGRVMVIERVPDDERPESSMDLRMLVMFGGRERSLSELTRLADAAALGVVAVHTAHELRMVELRPHG